MASNSSATSSDLERLLQKQEQEIVAIERKIELWTKYKSDYQDLAKLIDSMKDRVSHPHDIPIAGTQLAFMKGKIIHTNEITVLLGDNYFALRSSKQANEIIDRRLKNIDEMLNKSQDAKRKALDWLNVSREHKRDKEEFVEIIETA